MRFTIGSSTVYDMQSLDRLTLLQILRLEVEMKNLGRDMKWRHIREMATSLEGLEGDALEDHDDFMWVVALAIWASRLSKGEETSFAEAIDFAIGDLTFLPEPEDRKPGKAQPRKGSAGAGKRPANKAAMKTSETLSSPA